MNLTGLPINVNLLLYILKATRITGMIAVRTRHSQQMQFMVVGTLFLSP